MRSAKELVAGLAPTPWTSAAEPAPIGDTGDADLPLVIRDANGKDVLTIWEDYRHGLEQPFHERIAERIVTAVNAVESGAADYIERTAAPADGPEFETTAEERARLARDADDCHRLGERIGGWSAELFQRLYRDLDKAIASEAAARAFAASETKRADGLQASIDAMKSIEASFVAKEAFDEVVAERDREAAARREADAAVKILRGIIEKERSFAADIITRIKRIIDSYWWLIEGRGPYEYDDDRWRGEFKSVAGKLRSEAEKLRQQAADWSNCPTDPAEIVEARTDWKARAEQAEAERATLRAALWDILDHKHSPTIRKIARAALATNSTVESK